MDWNLQLLTVLITVPSYVANPTAPKQYFVNVTPTCERQSMKLILTFDGGDWPEGRFEDWIVVGTNNRAECRLRGNGELQYVIELAVFNDPCETQMPSAGVFQNQIRIGKNPAIILLGDRTYIIRCTYGLPEISQLNNPIVNPSFKAVTLADFPTNSMTNGSFDAIGGIVEGEETTDKDDNTLISWPILLSIIVGLFAILLILTFAFACFRWKVENEPRNFRSQNVRSNDITISKFGISDLWWNDKNVVKLNKLQHAQITNDRSTATVRSTVHMNSSLSSNSSIGSVQNAQNTSARTSSQQHSTTTDSGVAATEDLPQCYSEWRSRTLLDLSNKRLNNNADLKRCASLRTDEGAVAENQLLQVPSITEIYRSAEVAFGDGDASSQSTLEGISYMPNYYDSAPTIDQLIQCIGKIRGIGSRKLTEQEFGRWRRLVTSNATFRDALVKARGIKQIEAVCLASNYKKLFAKEKWNSIIRCIIEQQQCNAPENQFIKRNNSQRRDLVSSSLNVYIGDVGSNDR
ncbi:unnamed protein product [Litomosoides sigmodontis]|uniref:ZP domain-containing protein n=1 Tax=Litomosoides sigmodontis TaxID=42156 RepID=A0A3P7LXV3_LITSI|nr:unnamed protein product [Litomosoides sigmodontis]